MEKVDNQWLRSLTALNPETVIQLASQLAKDWKVSYEAIPQKGLSLLQLQDSVFKEPYYLGEIPLSTAQVRLENADGQSYQGGVQVMSDLPDFATSLAICDAIFSNELIGCEQARTRS